MKSSQFTSPPAAKAGKAQEGRDGDPSGQRLGDVPHHLELLGSDQPELARLPVFVNGHFVAWRQLGGALNLVDQERPGMALQEMNRIFPGQVQTSGVVQRHVLAVSTGQMFEEGGFARPPGSGEHDDRKKGRGVHDAFFDGPGEIHLQLRPIYEA